MGQFLLRFSLLQCDEIGSTRNNDDRSSIVSQFTLKMWRLDCLSRQFSSQVKPPGDTGNFYREEGRLQLVAGAKEPGCG